MDVMTADIDALKDKAADAARLLRALSNERRLLVMCLLAASGEMSVGPMAERVDLSQSALSQHLALLREDGLVATRREGTTIYYRIADARVGAVLKLMHDLYCPELG